jgi:putative aldouronate transport system substrate-binding protein
MNKMYERSKKQVSLLFSAGLVLSLLAGCSGNPTPAGNGPDKNGDKKEELLKVKMLSGLYSEVPDMNNAFWTELQKRLKVKLDIEWIPAGDFNTKSDLVLASGDLPEILAYPNLPSVTLLNAIKNGAFWDLTPLLGDLSDYPNLKNNLAPNALKYLSLGGKIYALPRSRSLIDLSIPIRKDWLDKLGLAVPTTLEQYEEALKKIVEGDPDGNGKKDTYGIVGQGVIVADGDGAFGAAFGTHDPTYNADGGMIYHSLTPQYTELVAWFRKLYSQGILPKEFATMKKTQAEEMYQTGRAASFVRGTRYIYDWEQGAKKVQPEAKFIALPPMKGPKGYSVQLSTGVNGGFYISKKVPEAKVKQILKYLDASASKEITDLAYNGIEGVHYTMEGGQRKPTALGSKEINTTSLGATVLAYTQWGKVDNPGAPKAYNDEKHKEVADYEKLGKVNPFDGLVSNTWLDIWPKYEAEFKSMIVKAIVAQISMEDFKAYVDKLNNLPEFKKAYKEFGDAYKDVKISK